MQAAGRPFRLTLRRTAVATLTALFFAFNIGSAGAADPNTLGKGSADAVTVVRWIAPETYQLDVQNTSGIGYINQFTWVPPGNLTVTAITSTEGGHCSLVGGSIKCNGKIAPPTCTCLAGGDLVVTFQAKGLEPTYNGQYWTYYGIVGAFLQIQQMTPVPYHIPSSQPQGADLPLCKKGQAPTKANPCV